MRGDRCDWISRAECDQKPIQLNVLGVGERVITIAFDLDTDREFIANGTAAPRGNTGMPGTIIAAHKLQQRAISP